MQAGLSPLAAAPFVAMHSAPRMSGKVQTNARTAAPRQKAARVRAAPAKTRTAQKTPVKKRAVMKEKLREAKAGNADSQPEETPVPIAKNAPKLAKG